MEANVYVLLGVVTPLIVAIIASARWSSQAKGLLAMAASIVIGVATAYASHLLTTANVVGSILAAYGAAQVVYTALFKPLGITSWILDNLGAKGDGA